MTEQNKPTTLSLVEAPASTPNFMSWLRQQKLIWALAAGGAALSLAGCTTAKPATPEHTTHSVLPTPEVTKTPKAETDPDVPSAELLASFKLGADATPQQMGEAYAAAQSQIWGGRLSPSLENEITDLQNGTSAQTVANRLSKEWVTPFCDALFIPNWQQNQVLDARCTYLTQQVAIGMANDTGDGSLHISYALTNVDVLSSTPTQRIVNIGMGETYMDDNASDPNLDQNGRQSVEQVTYTLTNGQWLISNWGAIS